MKKIVTLLVSQLLLVGGIMAPLGASALTEAETEHELRQIFVEHNANNRLAESVVPTQEELEALTKLISASPDVQAADVLTVEIADRALEDAYLASKLTYLDYDPELQKMRKFFSFQEKSDPIKLIHKIMSIVKSPDSCVRTDESGMECRLAIKTNDVDMAAEITNPNTGETEAVLPISHDQLVSLLGGHTCTSTATSENSQAQASASSDPDEGENSHKDADGSGVSPLCLDKAYGYVLYYRYKCSIIDGCRAVAQAAGAITASYLYTTADTLGATASAALRCNFGCMSRSALDIAFNNGDLFETIYSNASKRYVDAHGAGTMLQYMSAQSCLVTPAPAYTLRPIYQELKDESYTLPFDDELTVKLGTHHQIHNNAQLLGGLIHGYTNTSVTPNSTSTGLIESVPGTLPTARYNYWQYKFFKERTFDWNFVYAASDDYFPVKGCSIRLNMNEWVPHVNASASGNQHWLYHGPSSGGSYGFAEINWIVGFEVDRTKSCEY